MDVILQAEIKQCVTDEVAKVMAELNDHGADLDSILTKIQEVLENIPGSMVKSVQKGRTNAETVAIATVDPDKCIVILDNEVLVSGLKAGGSTSSYQDCTDGATLVSLTATTLSLTTNDYFYYKSNGLTVSSIGTVSWQIIEFY